MQLTRYEGERFLLRGVRTMLSDIVKVTVIGALAFATSPALGAANNGVVAEGQQNQPARTSANLAANRKVNIQAFGPFGPDNLRARFLPEGGPIHNHAETATALAKGLTIQTYISALDGKVLNETDFKVQAGYLGMQLAQNPTMPKLGEIQVNQGGNTAIAHVENHTNKTHQWVVELADGTRGAVATLDPGNLAGVDVQAPAVAKPQEALLKCLIHGNVSLAQAKSGSGGLYAMFIAVPNTVDSLANERERGGGPSNLEQSGHQRPTGAMNRALERASPYYAAIGWLQRVWTTLRGKG